jgi:hypothetical protein
MHLPGDATSRAAFPKQVGTTILAGLLQAATFDLESDPVRHRLVNQAILVLERNDPAEGRPLVDAVTASRIASMKRLRPPSAGRSEIRVLDGP